MSPIQMHKVSSDHMDRNSLKIHPLGTTAITHTLSLITTHSGHVVNHRSSYLFLIRLETRLGVSDPVTTSEGREKLFQAYGGELD